MTDEPRPQGPLSEREVTEIEQTLCDVFSGITKRSCDCV